jgi:predicted DNA-binding protein
MQFLEEEHEMAELSNKISQIHVRIAPELKKDLKIFRVRQGTTEQAWLSELIETELREKAPDLWSERLPPTRRSGR